MPATTRTIKATIKKPTKTCLTCGHDTPIPLGVDASNVRCPNVEAMWHGAYTEVLTRIEQSANRVQKVADIVTALGVALAAEQSGLAQTREAVFEDAKRLADLIGE